MNKIKPHISSFTGKLIVVAALAWGISAAAAQKKGATNDGPSYYKDGGTQIFNPYPTDTGRHSSRSWLVRNFGPVGIGINLKRPGMTMEINNVEKGSCGCA